MKEGALLTKCKVVDRYEVSGRGLVFVVEGEEARLGSFILDRETLFVVIGIESGGSGPPALLVKPLGELRTVTAIARHLLEKERQIVDLKMRMKDLKYQRTKLLVELEAVVGWSWDE